MVEASRGQEEGVSGRVGWQEGLSSANIKMAEVRLLHEEYKEVEDQAQWSEDGSGSEGEG